MSWWPPWRRDSDKEIRRDALDAKRRLDESEELKVRARRSEHSMRGHIRRNRFGEMIERQVFGGGGEVGSR